MTTNPTELMMSTTIRPCAFCDKPARYKFCQVCLPPFSEWRNKPEYHKAYRILERASWPDQCSPLATRIPSDHPSQAQNICRVPLTHASRRPLRLCKWCGKNTTAALCQDCEPYRGRIEWMSKTGKASYSHVPSDHPSKRGRFRYPSRLERVERDCILCGDTFTTTPGTVTCGCLAPGTPEYRRKYRQWYNQNTTKGKDAKTFYAERPRRALAYIYSRDGYNCHLCKKPIDPKLNYPHNRAATVDHVIPRSQGGTNEVVNLAAAHWSCNASKGTKPMGEQLRLIG